MGDKDSNTFPSRKLPFLVLTIGKKILSGSFQDNTC